MQAYSMNDPTSGRSLLSFETPVQIWKRRENEISEDSEYQER